MIHELHNDAVHTSETHMSVMISWNEEFLQYNLYITFRTELANITKLQRDIYNGGFIQHFDSTI